MKRQSTSLALKVDVKNVLREISWSKIFNCFVAAGLSDLGFWGDRFEADIAVVVPAGVEERVDRVDRVEDGGIFVDEIAAVAAENEDK
jgi:hypothetical protein